MQLNEGKADLSYQAPGYGRLQDSINVVNGKNKTIIKKIQRDSVDGWSSILLLIPGVFGLLIACFKEKANTDKADKTSTYSQMMVALANSVIWAVVLVCIWGQVSLLNGVTKIQLFHSSLSFEFFVPFLGYLGSLLFVFDLFRAKDSDTFKNKEFGMRIIMGPYVAIVVVSLFGKEFDFVNLESVTGQGVLAFVSGLIVVVAIQGIIERANEKLGSWRRKNNPYVASPLAEKFDLSQEEDKALSDLALRHPDQLLMLSDAEIEKKLKETNSDKHLVLAIKRKIEGEHLKEDIGDLVWNRLKPDNVTTIQGFAVLSMEKLQNIANQKPELSDERLKQLQDKIIQYMDGNGHATVSYSSH